MDWGFFEKQYQQFFLIVPYLYKWSAFCLDTSVDRVKEQKVVKGSDLANFDPIG